MKGVSHFVSGVAAASFLPQVVQMSAAGSFILVLAGVSAILPDTLDFRLARYLTRADVEVDPDPQALDPQEMAEQVARAIDQAAETDRPVRVQLHTAQLSAGRWRQYSVHLQPGTVEVRIGPLVGAMQVPLEGSEPNLPAGHATFGARVRHRYEDPICVDAFSGPMLAFQRRGDVVEAEFLPWHRRWSHSLALVLLLAAIAGLAFGPLHGLVCALGVAVHIVEDQLGHLGSSLAYPFCQRRVRGLRLFHSGDVLPNLLTVWLSGAALLFNLDRFSPSPAFDPATYLLCCLVPPVAAILAALWRRRGRGEGRRRSTGDAQVQEIAAEAEEVSS